jgi:hypothetical protein
MTGDEGWQLQDDDSITVRAVLWPLRAWFARWRSEIKRQYLAGNLTVTPEHQKEVSRPTAPSKDRHRLALAGVANGLGLTG